MNINRGNITKVCIVIVTYNRKECLLRCLEKCLNQTIETDILVFDNHSSDGTEELLRLKGLLDNNRIIYHYNDSNIGGAGGFSRGLKMAFEIGYDFYWVMDDDGFPYFNDCLESCIRVFNHYNSQKVIVNALVVGPDLKSLSFRTGGFIYKEDLIDNSNDLFFSGSISPFNGTLYSNGCLDEIGFPREDFFIKGDETEFTYRAIRSGYSVVTSIGSIFIHPLMPVNMRHFLWKEIDLGEEAYWKEYYKARNYVFIYQNYFNKVQVFKHFLYCLIKCLYYKEDKMRKIKYTLIGLMDGIKGKFDNIDIRK